MKATQLWLCGVWLSLLSYPALAGGPRNVILFIGDGMGFEHVKAAGMYLHGQPGTLFFETLPYQAEMITLAAGGGITDSAAAATAMATGTKVRNGVISMAIPGPGGELLTALEIAEARSKRTGLVTTTNITDATPAAFAAHEPSRRYYSAIAAEYLQQTRPDVLFGGGGNGLSPQDADEAGYAVITTADELAALDTETETMVSGQFGSGPMPFELDGLGELPHLSQMTAAALDILDGDPDGLFLMVEGGRIDHASHSNNIERAVLETIEFDRAVQAAADWAAGRDDTLIIVTADHECGGLTVLENNGAGQMPTVSWSTHGHTAANVPVYAWGPRAELIVGVIDNTDLFDVMVPDPPPPGDADLDGAVGLTDLNILADNYGRDDAGWMEGDFNTDGHVGIADLATIADNYGQGVGQTSATTAPEPTTATLLMSIASVLLAFRRRPAPRSPMPAMTAPPSSADTATRMPWPREPTSPRPSP